MLDSELTSARTTYAFPLLGFIIIATILLFHLNEQLFLNINNLSEHTGRWIWPILTVFGDPIIILCIGLSFLHIRPKIALAIFPAVILGAIVVFSSKWLFDVARPNLALGGCPRMEARVREVHFSADLSIV